MLELWVESFLPRRCLKTLDAGGPFNPSSHNVHVGPLGTVSGPSTVYTTSTKDEVGVARQKRAVTEPEVKSPAPLVRSKRFLSDLSSMFPGMSMAMPGSRRGAQKEVSESAQMMKTLLLISKIQKRRAMQSVKRYKEGGKIYSGDKYNFGSGLYGDSYSGKRKRRSVDAKSESQLVESEAGSSNEPLVRKKRFLFGDAPDVPAAQPAMPSMLSILMGTARDPNTGKKVEFGGDYMKNMMRSSFMSAMPHLAGNTPPGKEPPDVVKNLAPIWYFSRMQGAMRPRRPLMMNGYESYHMMRRASPGSIKSRNRDGYYGDSFPGMMGKRRRRSVDSGVDVDSDSVKANKRVKRQSEEGSNDVITIGDLSIPTDFFKPAERSEEPKYYGGYKQPDDARYYHRYSAPQHHYYQPPQQSRYHQQQHYYRQQLQRQKQLQQQQQQKFYQQYSHLYSLYLQAVGAKQAQPTSNQWAPPATRQAPQTPPAHPPAQQRAPVYTPPAPAHSLPAQSPPPNNYGPPPRYAHSPAAQAPPNSNIFPAFPPQPTPPIMHQHRPFSAPQSSNQLFGPPQAQSHYLPVPPPPQTYPIDPFIPNPPLPPLSMTTPLPSRKKRSIELGEVWGTELHRHKRSDDSDKDKTRYNKFFFPQAMFTPALFSSYFPPRYSVYSNKVGYHQPRGGGVIYGDRLPWRSSWAPPQIQARPATPVAPKPPPTSVPPSARVSQRPAQPSPFLSPSAPASRQPPPTSGSVVPPARVSQQPPQSSAVFSPSAPASRQPPPTSGSVLPPARVSQQPPQSSAVFSPSAPVSRRLPSSSAPLSPSSLGLFPALQSAPVSLHPPPVPTHRRVKRSDNKDNPDSSPNFLFGPPFFSSFLFPVQNHHNKVSYSAGRSGVVYGDQMPWARPTPVAPHLSSSAASAPSAASSSFGGPLDQYLSMDARPWGQRG